MSSGFYYPEETVRVSAWASTSSVVVNEQWEIRTATTVYKPSAPGAWVVTLISGAFGNSNLVVDITIPSEHDSDEEGGFTFYHPITVPCVFTPCYRDTVASLTTWMAATSGPAGNVHAAIVEGDNTRIYSFANGVATRRDRILIAGNHIAGLFRNRSNALYLATQIDTGGGISFYRSDTNGETLTAMGNVWDPALYKYAHVNQTLDGGFVSVSIKKATEPWQVWFRRSVDGTTWDNAPVLVGELGAIGARLKFVQVMQLMASGSARLIVTNGFDKMWYSDNMGLNWAVF